MTDCPHCKTVEFRTLQDGKPSDSATLRGFLADGYVWSSDSVLVLRCKDCSATRARQS